MKLKFPIFNYSEQQFWGFSDCERFVLVAAWLCDIQKVKETKRNSGVWVDWFLSLCGLGPGYAWCAAFVSACFKLAKIETGPKSGRARVANWYQWAKENNLLVENESPRRGDLWGYVNSDGTGHIGIVTNKRAPYVFTIEGNTNESGSREGTAVLRKQRDVRGCFIIRWKR